MVQDERMGWFILRQAQDERDGWFILRQAQDERDVWSRMSELPAHAEPVEA